MKIALVSPPLVGHEVRGTGVYRNNLKKGLETFTDVEVISATIENLPRQADLYHFPYFDPFFLTLPLVKSKKTIVTVHDLIPIKFPDEFPRGIWGEVKWQIQRLALTQSDAIITDSLASKTDIQLYTGIRSDKIYPIYLAADDLFYKKCDVEEQDRVIRTYHLPPRFALYVGDGNWNKNVPNIIRAAKKVNTPLIIVGKSFVEKHESAYHPWKESIIIAQEEAAESDLIKGIGRIDLDELAILYHTATVLLLPSYAEGFGLPIVEAFASGCPVIASKKGSLKEIAGDAALFVDPYNVTDIADAIKTIFSDPAVGEDLRKKGKQEVKKFSWKKTATETYNIYNQVLNNI